ncbi:MAG: hypothetical protein ACI4JS_06495 [Oscillospiraceae bacterium]
MAIVYDRPATLEFIENLDRVYESVRLKNTGVSEKLSACKAKFMRLTGELETDVRNFSMRLDDAQNEKIEAKRELQAAQDMMSRAENDNDREYARSRMESAKSRIAQSDQDIKLYTQKYQKAQALLAQLKEVGSRYLQPANSTVSKMESNAVFIAKGVSNAKNALNGYMERMEQIRGVLNDGSAGTGAASSGGSTAQATSSGSVGNTPSQSDSTPKLKPAWTTTENGDMVFDSPEETGERLVSNQGRIEKFGGTCGLCSVANIVILSGNPSSERNMVDVACEHDLCTHTSRIKSSNGATTAENRQALLSLFGIESMTIPQCERKGLKREYKTDLIADYVSKGHGVILSVHASTLYNGWTLGGDYHAVTVTGVKKNSQGNVLGFYICDSNNRPSTYLTTSQMEKALTKHSMNVTTNPIRTEYDYT